MVRFLDRAFAHARTSSSRGRDRHALGEFMDIVTRMGDGGYALGAAVFGRMVEERNVDRAVRSSLLTRLARRLHDASGAKSEPAESAVAHFGRFMDALVVDMPEMHVDWAEDMNPVDASDERRAEPTAVIRGVLLSPALDQRRCVRFWGLAAASSRFPRRVFSDPCPAEDGAIFSPYHCRAFGAVFTHAPPAAVEAFALHMREHATRKAVFRERNAAVPGSSWTETVVPASTHERARVFAAVAGNVLDPSRRERVAALFRREPRVAPPPARVLERTP